SSIDTARGPPLPVCSAELRNRRYPVWGQSSIEDSMLSGDAKQRADEALHLVDSNTSFDAHLYVVERTKQNNGKTPRNVLARFHWKEAFANHDGHLPGIP